MGIEQTASTISVKPGDEVLVACANASNGCPNMVRLRIEHTPVGGAERWPVCQSCRERSFYQNTRQLVHQLVAEFNGA